MPYALLLMAAAVVLGWLATDKNQPQSKGYVPELEQAILDRLSDIDRRLALIEATPKPMPHIQPVSNSPEIHQLRERIDNLEQGEAPVQGLEESYPKPIKDKRRLEAVPSKPKPAEVAASHFQESGNLNAEDAEDLEDVESIFDQAELPNTTFSQIDCRAGYCRLEYSVRQNAEYSSSSIERNEHYSSLSIEENEMILKLADKYGQDIPMYMSTSAEGEKVIYIKHGRE